MQRKSLLDGIPSAASSGKPRGGGTDSKDKIKLIAAVSLFAIATILLAWHYDLLPFGGGEVPPPATPEQIEQLQQQEAQNKILEEKGLIQQGAN